MSHIQFCFDPKGTGRLGRAVAVDCSSPGPAARGASASEASSTVMSRPRALVALSLAGLPLVLIAPASAGASGRAAAGAAAGTSRAGAAGPRDAGGAGAPAPAETDPRQRAAPPALHRLDRERRRTARSWSARTARRSPRRLAGDPAVRARATAGLAEADRRRARSSGEAMGTATGTCSSAPPMSSWTSPARSCGGTRRSATASSTRCP